MPKQVFDLKMEEQWCESNSEIVQVNKCKKCNANKEEQGGEGMVQRVVC